MKKLVCFNLLLTVVVGFLMISATVEMSSGVNEVFRPDPEDRTKYFVDLVEFRQRPCDGSCGSVCNSIHGDMVIYYTDHRQCPAGLWYNHTILMCDYPENCNY